MKTSDEDGQNVIKMEKIPDDWKYAVIMEIQDCLRLIIKYCYELFLIEFWEYQSTFRNNWSRVDHIFTKY